MNIVTDVNDIEGDFDQVHLLFAREDVETRNYASIKTYLKRFVADDKTHKARSKLNVGFAGYDDDLRELWEIVDVMNWVWQSVEVENIPWFYLLSTDSEALSIKILAMCYCAKLGEHGKMIVDTNELQNFVKRNFTNLDNYFAGNLPEEINLEISQNINRYIKDWIGGN